MATTSSNNQTKYSCIWKIPDLYNKMLPPNKQTSTSMIVKDGPGLIGEFKLMLALNGNVISPEVQKTSFTISICKMVTTPPMKVKVRFSVIDADNVAALACTHVFTFGHVYNHISVEDFISLEKLQDPDMQLLSNNTLSIRVDITDLSLPILDLAAQFRRKEPESTLVTALVAGMKNRVLTDCVLHCQGEDFHCHKFILASWSSVFQAMFTSNMVESNPDAKVQIEDLEMEAVRLMVRYLYTNSLSEHQLDGNAYSLLPAAEKYDLRELKLLCSKSLCKTLSVENCVQTLILADRYSAVDLKREVLDFIVHKGWGDFNKEELLVELSKELMLDLLFASMNPSISYLLSSAPA